MEGRVPESGGPALLSPALHLARDGSSSNVESGMVDALQRGQKSPDDLRPRLYLSLQASMPVELLYHAVMQLASIDSTT